MRKESVVVVGASLAGCAAAITLADGGVPVMLVDRAEFPRRKPCGEGLSMRGQLELEELGLELREACPESPQLAGYRICLGSRIRDLPAGSGGVLGIKRAVLDDKLLAITRQRSRVSFRGESPLRAVERVGSSFRLVIGGDTVVAEHLIVADGANSGTLARLANARRRLRRGLRVGCSSAWRVVEGTLPRVVLVFPERGGEVYLTPTGSSSVNISVLGTAEYVASMSNCGRLSRWLSLREESLAAALELEAPALGAGPLQSVRRGAAVCGAYVAGDACETFDPIGGMGMAHALMSGRSAGRAVARALASGEREAALASHVEEQESAARLMRGFTRVTSWMLGTRAGRAVIPVAVSSGLASRVSHAAHSGAGASGWSALLGVVGR